MASLQCSGCGEGIHYHGEPEGIEYVAFELDSWNSLIDTDLTIISYDEHTDRYLTMWRCPECGTMHVFKPNSNWVWKVFKPCNETTLSVAGGTEYIIFDDHNYFDITETDITGKEYMNTYPEKSRMYGVILGNKMVFFKTAGFDKPFWVFDEIPVITEIEREMQEK